MKHFNISDNLKSDILTTLVEPTYKSDVSSNLKLRKKFKNWGICFETLSKLFVGVSSVLSFSSGIYKYDTLSFMAGTASVLSLVLLQYASFSYRESKKMTTELNAILSKLHITPVTITDNASYCEGSETTTPQSLMKV